MKSELHEGDSAMKPDNLKSTTNNFEWCPAWVTCAAQGAGPFAFTPTRFTRLRAQNNIAELDTHNSKPAETANLNLRRMAYFSIGRMGNFQPVSTQDANAEM
jgi:hypothetical protein